MDTMDTAVETVLTAALEGHVVAVRALDQWEEEAQWYEPAWHLRDLSLWGANAEGHASHGQVCEVAGSSDDESVIPLLAEILNGS